MQNTLNSVEYAKKYFEQSGNSNSTKWIMGAKGLILAQSVHSLAKQNNSSMNIGENTREKKPTAVFNVELDSHIEMVSSSILNSIDVPKKSLHPKEKQ
jgi:hypothetical protein